MDSKVSFKVLNSNIITGFGIIVELENVENGFPKNGVLKSTKSNLFWEVKSRIIEDANEKRFEFEEEIQAHLNFKNTNPNRTNILKLKEEKNIRLYKIESIGHSEQPEIRESLVFHATTFRQKIKIRDIYATYFLLEDENGYLAVIPKKKSSKKYTSTNWRLRKTLRASISRFGR